MDVYLLQILGYRGNVIRTTPFISEELALIERLMYEDILIEVKEVLDKYELSSDWIGMMYCSGDPDVQKRLTGMENDLNQIQSKYGYDDHTKNGIIGYGDFSVELVRFVNVK